MNKGVIILIIAVLAFGAVVLLRSPETSPEAPAEEADRGAALEDINTNDSMKITSSAFERDGVIPAQYTCDGENINPPLTIEGVSEGTASLVLIVDDPDIPQEVKESAGIEVFDHWVLFNILTDTIEIAENSAPGTQGANSRGGSAYTGPCPPPQYEPKEHRYFFKLSALDTELELGEGSTKTEVEQAMKGHVLKEAQLIGRYSRR